MFDDDSITFRVVANHQEQYSIWPTFKDIPAGWMAVGPEGKKDECLDYIEKVWTDMRPKTLRDKMKKDQPPPEPPAEVKEAATQVVSKHSGEVSKYGEGLPELYGWFVARIIETHPDFEPDAVRAALDEVLPPHNVPDNYA